MSAGIVSPPHTLADKLSSHAGGSSMEGRGEAPVTFIQAREKCGACLPAPAVLRCGEGITGQSGAGMVGMFIGNPGNCTRERIEAVRPGGAVVTKCMTCGIRLVRTVRDPEIAPLLAAAGSDAGHGKRSAGPAVAPKAIPHGNHGDNNGRTGHGA